MKLLFRIWLFIGFAGMLTPATAQCPLVDFVLPATGCLNETRTLTNLSGPGSYLWDFCPGELDNTPSAQDIFLLPDVYNRPGIDLAFDGNFWYGFVTGFFTNSLYRLEFANGTTNAPTLIQNLGDLGGKLNNPGQVRILQEANQWYAIIHNATPGELVKVSFGDKLSNGFTTIVLATGIATGAINAGIALGRDPLNGWVCIVSNVSGQFINVRLGFNLASPGPADIITSPAVTSAADVELINVCGNWFGFAAGNFGNENIYRLSFGTNLFSTPVITPITGIPAGTLLGRLRMIKDGENYHLLVTSLNASPLFKLKFGNDVTQNPVIVAESSLTNVPADSYGLGVAKDKSTWTVIVIGLNSGRAMRIIYPENCQTINSGTRILRTPRILGAQY